MFDRPEGGDKAVLVSLDFGQTDYDEDVEELCRLVESAGLEIVEVIKGRRSRPDAALFAGSGKVDEIALALKESGAALTVFNHELSAAQERNLERALDCRVIDRTTLILDIFAQRARSHEGKLQVELAQLEHLSTRLVRGWSHLERQRGGIGLRGPGETQLETDRRLLGKRVKLLKGKLATIQRQRKIQRRARQRSDTLSVSLVGYTNAGKSTLFNAMTHAKAYAADQLFATLDTTSRRLFLPESGTVVLSDTVGFIKHLPHSLVAAFRATLEEAIQADLLLHVVDASSSNYAQQIEEVNKVLVEIGADTIPQVKVMNKIDLKGLSSGVERDEYGKIAAVRVSARTGDGLEYVRQALAETVEATRLQNRPEESATVSHIPGPQC